jgi:N-methylhydantoinase B
MAIDKITLEVMRNYFQAIVEDAARIIERTAFTTFVKETADFSTGLVSTEGEYIAYPWKLGATPFLGINLAGAIAFTEKYEEGDVLIMNDPYSTAGLCTHLPDLQLLKPIFHDGSVIAFAYAFIHSSDVGGIVPASVSPRATEIFQEGLRLRPTKLFRAGLLNQDLVNILADNSRIPDMNWGDIKAMIAAVNSSERRLIELVAKFGAEVVRAGAAELLNHVEKRSQAALAEIPDGTYRFVDYMEDDMVSEVPVRLELTMTVKAGRVHLDYTGTDPQVSSSLNIATSGVVHPFVALGLIAYIITQDPEIPKAGSILRPVTMTLPLGTIVNPVFPAACGVRFGTVLRLADVVLGALAQAVPHKVPAASAGASSPVVCSLLQPRTHRRYVTVVEPMQGGGGAHWDRDGVNAREPISGHTRNTPVESLEADIPIVIRRYHLIPDSGGAGRYRGGMGVRLDFQVFHPDSVVAARGMERFKMQPWGLDGGHCGAAGQAIVNPDTDRAHAVGKFDVLRLEPGDVISFRWPAGAGYGDALEREPQRVYADWKAGLVSTESARNLYGVVLGRDSVDEDGTRELRDQLAGSRGPRTGFDFGPYRRALEHRWPPELAEETARLVSTLPSAVRDYVKHDLFRTIVAIAETQQPTRSDLLEAWKAVLARLERALV